MTEEGAIMKKCPILLLFLLSLAAAFLACSTTEGKGGGGLEPGTTEPEIIEGFLCAGVFEGRPTGIDNEFFVDDIVYIWLSWINVAGQHTLKILWVDPNEKIFESSQTFDSKTGKMVTYMWLDTSLSAPVGRWAAEVYLDEKFVRSYGFWLNAKN